MQILTYTGESGETPRTIPRAENNPDIVIRT